MGIIIREATEEDVLPIQHFISKAGVSIDSITFNWKGFLVAEDVNRAIVGTVALQPVSETDTLIRTLIIDAEKANASFLLRMLETALQYAWQTNATTVYLMAKQAGDMLENLGFKQVTKEEIPAIVAEVPEVSAHLENGLPILMQKESVNK